MPNRGQYHAFQCLVYEWKQRDRYGLLDDFQREAQIQKSWQPCVVRSSGQAVREFQWDLYHFSVTLLFARWIQPECGFNHTADTTVSPASWMILNSVGLNCEWKYSLKSYHFTFIMWYISSKRGLSISWSPLRQWQMLAVMSFIWVVCSSPRLMWEKSKKRKTNRWWWKAPQTGVQQRKTAKTLPPPE